MTWVKLDDQFYEDDAVLELTSPSSLALYVVGLAYCGNKLNDGLIPRSALRRKLLSAAFADQSHADELVLVGLWEIQEHGGYLVRNFLKFNRSRDAVDAKRGEARERGQRRRDSLKSLKPENSTDVRANAARTSRGVPSVSVSVSEALDLQLKEKVSADSFDEFYDLYPKKDKPSDARRAWKKLSAADQRLALDSVKHYRRIYDQVAAVTDRKVDMRKFQSGPAPWLNGGKHLLSDDDRVADLAYYLPKQTQVALTANLDNIKWSD